MANGWGGARRGSGPKTPGTSASAQRRQRLREGAAAGSSSSSPRQLAISLESMMDLIRASQQSAKVRPRTREFCPYVIDPRKGAYPPPESTGLTTLAMDEDIKLANDGAVEAWMAGEIGGIFGTAASEGLVFFGYPYLSELAQRPEYRTFAEVLSTEMTRKWIRLKGTAQKREEDRDEGDEGARDRILALEKPNGPTSRASGKLGDDDKGQQIKELTDYMEHMKVRSAFRDAALYDFFMGRSHLMLDSGDEDQELKTPIGTGDGGLVEAKVGVGWLKSIRNVEAIWCYPQAYNAQNPLAPNWYRPDWWYVLGRQIHRTRLLPFIGRPVPDMLKPAYSFGGLAMSQMAEPYVTIWLQTRQAVAEMIRTYSTMNLATDLSVVLQGGAGAANLLTRATLYNTLRDNQALLLTNKNTEDLNNVAVPLSGLHELQAQSQEHMMSVARIPAIVFTGIQPAGLSSTSEGELKTFEQTIGAMQLQTLDPNLVFVIDVCQMSLRGARDPDITHEWVPLRSLSEKEQAEVDKIKAEAASIRIGDGVLWQEEERARLASDPQSDYPDLDVEDVPDVVEEEAETGLDPEAAVAAGGVKKGLGAAGGEGGGRDAVLPFAGAQDELPQLDRAFFEKVADADALEYLQGLTKLSFTPNESQWNAHYDATADEIIVEGKLIDAPAREQLHVLLHEAGHRGGLRVDRSTFRAFLAREFDLLPDFLEIANKAHLRDFERTGKVDGVAQELFAESYARALLGEPLPPGVAAFWRERLAHGIAQDANPRPAAGVMFTTPANHALFLRWSEGHPRAGEWAFPGGGLEAGEQPEDAARREAGEETGWLMSDSDYLPLLDRNGDHGASYWTFKHPVQIPFQPRLSGEHDGYAWRHVGDPPAPLHPGVERLLRAGYTPTGDDASFEESKHPRAPDGKFASGGGGAPHKAAEGWTPGHAEQAQAFLAKPAPAGQNYRRALRKLIKDAQIHAKGLVGPLKSKLVESLTITYSNFVKKGDAAKAQKVANQIKKFSGAVPAAAPPPPKPAAPKLPPPTGAELEKAKKTAPLQLQYLGVSGAPDNPATKALVKQFNDKYAGKTLTDPAALAGKVADFKAVQAAVASIAGDAAKEQLAAQQKAQEQAAAKAAKLAEQAKAEAKANAEKNKGLMKDLGITEQEAEGFGALAQMLGKSDKDLSAAFKGYEAKAQGYGYPITGFQAALISNYTDGGYAQINKALRSGSWTVAQHVYVKMVNKALQSMPRYTGTLRRGTGLSSEDQALYKVGHVVEERAFTSTSISSPFGGNTKYTIKAIGKRGAHVKKLSNHPGEDEVVYSARTFFKVTKIEGSPGGQMHVHMEEMEE